MSFRDCSVKVTIFLFYLKAGKAAFHLAAEHEHTDVVELLIQHSADITVKDNVRIKLGISNDKTSFICHLSSGSLSTVLHKITSKCNWMRIHANATG